MNGEVSSWLGRQLTVGNIAALGMFLIGIGYFIQQMQAMSTELMRFEAEQARYADTRRTYVDGAFTALNVKVQPVDGLVYRVGIAEGAINAANARIDRLADALHDSVAPLNDKISTLTTRVEVLTSSIDRAVPLLSQQQRDGVPNKAP